MKTKTWMMGGLALTTVLFTACKNDEANKKHEFTTEEKEMVQEFYDKKDSAVVNAYLDDKSTIQSGDIPKDASFSARTKTLYTGVSNPNEKLALVRGFKAKEGELGLAIYQVDTKEPVHLKQIKTADPKTTEYVNDKGNIKLQVSGDFVFIQADGGSVQYERVK